MAVEHGLSLWIETADRTILFDMGQSDLFAQNAAQLGIDLAKADLAVLSHGHYDHGGGLPHFLTRNTHAPVYVSRYAFDACYNAVGKYIGLDPALADSTRLVFGEGTQSLSPSLTLFDGSACPRRSLLGTFGLTRREGESLIPDDFRHEQYLLVEEAGKRVLFSGCSHRGIDDIAAYFRPDVLIGGFHVSKLTDQTALSDLSVKLNAVPTRYYTCHCTGTEQAQFLRKAMPNLFCLHCGDSIEL